MDTQSLKLVLESLIATVREQHLQIQGSYGLLTKFRACFSNIAGGLSSGNG